MKKVKKVVREEETCVAVLEWTSSSQDDGQRHKWVLITRRPEKGTYNAELSTGLYNFRAVPEELTKIDRTSSRF